MMIKNYKEASKLCENYKAKLMVVSKNQSIEHIEPLIGLGQRLFGENRVQEAMHKWPIIKKQYPDIQLHLIGPLQTNKVKEALSLFDCIQTLDRPKLAHAILEILTKQQRPIPLMIQINIGEEKQKAGVMPYEAESFITYCMKDLKLPIVGLMAIPPAKELPEPYFHSLKKLADQLGLKEVSMGMSNDFEMALQCGSTMVRLGRCIFE